MTTMMRSGAQGWWVRLTKADGEQTLWCVNTSRARAVEIYKREVARAEAGDEVEWGVSEEDR